MSGAYDEILASARDTAPLGEMDLSYLDSFRKGGAAGLREKRESDELAAESVEPEPELEPENEEFEAEPEADTENPHPEVEGSPTPEDALDESVDEREIEPDGDDERNDAEPSGFSKGGSAAAASGSAAGAASDEALLPEETGAVNLDEAIIGKPPASTSAPRSEQQSLSPAAERARVEMHHPTKLQKAAVAAARKGGSGGGANAPVDVASILPGGAFEVFGVKSQPNIKALPDALVEALRDQVSSVLIEQGVPQTEAVAAAKALGQNTLVTAFLMAQLDVRLDVDARTAKVAELFRHKSPLLGALMERMTALELVAQDQLEETRKTAKQLSEVKQTTATVEQAVAYSLANNIEHLEKGRYNVDDLDLTHASALRARDRLRDETKKQNKIERDRDGRSGAY